MRVIYKYPLPLQDIVELRLNKGAKIIDIRTQKDQPMLWAEVFTSRPMEFRTLYIVGTGQSMDHLPSDIEHIGSYHLYDGQLVFHVYERPWQESPIHA